MKLPNKLAINTIYKNLPGLNQEQLDKLNDSVSVSPQNVVKMDIKSLTKKSGDKTFAVRLTKWVEPYNIGGIDYSLFYTEVDHNYKVGDKVFIVGGEYDSDNLRESTTDPYYPGIDGYEVLYVDRTKVVLDIEFTGVDPTNEEPIDNFIKVYVASTQYEFEYFLQALTMRNDNGNVSSKFQIQENTFLYLNGDFNLPIGKYNNIIGYTDQFFNITTSESNVFVSSLPFFSSRLLYNVTTFFENGDVAPILNPNYTDPTDIFYNIGKIRVMNGRFKFGGTEFKRDHIYYYNNTQNKWMVDRSYMPTIITKSNFRGGVFDSGEFNQGLYGHYDERLDYNGSNIKWTLGTTLNVNWLDGTLGSDHFFKDSNFTVFDRNDLPQVRANSENNGGAGYNYVFDTDFEGGDVINGNIFNLSTFFGTQSSVSALEEYIDGNSITYSVTLSGGVYYNSDILFANIKNSTFISSYVVNSLVEDSKSVNSEIVSSAFVNSLYLGDNVIKIQAYEESNIRWFNEDTPLSTGVDYKMYKFYITDASFLRMRELQYFYLKDVTVNLPNQELINFFDDKFQIGHWTQTYDVIGDKPAREVLVQLSTKEDNRNSPGVITTETDLQPNFDNTLPSIDIFISGGDDFNFASASSYPRIFIENTITVDDAYVLEGDFVSGLFKDSTWVSGNYVNYNLDYSMKQVDGVYDGSTTFGPLSIDTSEQSIDVKLPNEQRPNIIGTSSYQSKIVFLNSMYYDSTLNTLNTGTNLVRLPDTYKVTSYSTFSTNTQYTLRDVSTQSTISNWGYNVNNPNWFTSRFADNRYNYIHPVKFENSEIQSGYFRRAYFDNCKFTNFDFNTQDKDLIDIIEKRNFLVNDVIFDDNSNIIESGMFQYSHFLAGDDDWRNGIFSRGFWSESTFTYSFNPTSSLLITREPSKFKNGVFRESEWENGVFEDGIFYKNNSNEVGTIDVFNGTASVYYTDDLSTKWSWQDGTFENGDFEKSNFEKGTFEDGNFFNSNFLTGIAIGGNFGRNNIPYERSRVYMGTFSNINVINAEFRTEHPTGQYLTSSIMWNSGIFNSGEFGTNMTFPYSPSNYAFSSTWLDGTFNGGDFTDIAEWKDGTFNGGRFRSYYQYNGYTPYELNTATSASFSWQGGEFNNGEFGRSNTATNSTWFSGEFNGGKFSGRYWKDGIFTRGQFNGHAASYSTSLNEYNKFMNTFHTDYYGYWNSGFVSEVKDKFITDKKIWTNVERLSTKKRKRPNVNFKNMYWASGTFSHTDGEIENSVWTNGSYMNGKFTDSAFNPYRNIALPFYEDTVFSNWTLTSGTTPTQSDEYLHLTNDATVVIEDCLFIGETYTFQVDVDTNTFTNATTINSGTTMFNSGATGIITDTFVATTTDLEIVFSGAGELLLRNLVIYPGTISGFNTSDNCIWENGVAYSSDIYFSKWKQGTFDSYATSSQGNAWGTIWQDGIVRYQNAYNVLWENGVWKNGNWFGSPFNQTSTHSNINAYPGFVSDILNNTAVYASQSLALDDWDTLHMNDTFTGSFGGELCQDPEIDTGVGGVAQTGWSAESIYNTIGGFVADNNLESTTDFAQITVLDTSLSEDIFGTPPVSTPPQQYIIKIKYSAYSISPNPSHIPILNLRFDIGYVGTSTTDDQSSNGGIRRYISTPLKTVPLSPMGSHGSTINEVTYYYTPTNLDISDSRKLKITRLSHTGDSLGLIVNILSVSVQPYDIVYDELTNNELWNVPTWTPTIGQTVELPSSIIYNVGDLKSLFGNGRFLAGIWENGVWNEGWRDDKTTLWASNIFNFNGGKNYAYKTEKYKTTWDVRLNIVQNDQSPGRFDDFSIGDKVAVGNIVTIDINNNRRLIRDFVIITDKFEGFVDDPFTLNNQIFVKTITIQFETTFPIRSVERDSDRHVITITKNVWLNGVFLNGKFLNGVWNNGLMQGFPYITEMVDQHWVDGNFKGGRFQGLTSSYLDNFGNTPTEFHTGLIQKFVFSDENVSNEPFRFKYNSWIDVNYFRTSGVNINRVNDAFKPTPLLFTASFTENNYYGFPTMDVLESISTIRNGYDLNERTYKLGWKYKEFIEWIPQQEIQFNSINQYTWNNTTSGNQIIPLDNGSGFGLGNLESNGWTFGYGSTDIFGDSDNSIVNNYGNLPIEQQNKLIFNGGKNSPSTFGAGTDNYTFDVIDNDNVDIENLRYCYVEVTAENLNPTQIGSELNPIVFFNNYPASYSVAAKTFYYGNTQSYITIPVNQLATSSVTNQREYFFNKKGLDMTLLGASDPSGGTFSIAFDKIRLAETDMIPFFNFTGDCLNISGSTATPDTVTLPEWNEDGLTVTFRSNVTAFTDSPWDSYFTDEQTETPITNPNVTRGFEGDGFYRLWYWTCDPQWGVCQLRKIQFGTSDDYAQASSPSYGTILEGYALWSYHQQNPGAILDLPGAPGDGQPIWVAYAYATLLDPLPGTNYAQTEPGVEIPGAESACSANGCGQGVVCEGFINIGVVGSISGAAEPGDQLKLAGGYTINNEQPLNNSDYTAVWTLPDGSTQTVSLPNAYLTTTSAGNYTLTITENSTGCEFTATQDVSNILGCEDYNVTLTLNNGQVNAVVTLDGNVIAGVDNNGNGFGANNLNNIQWEVYQGVIISQSPFFTYTSGGTPQNNELSYPFGNNDPVGTDESYKIIITVADCTFEHILYIPSEGEPSNATGLYSKIFLNFAGYTQSYTNHSGTNANKQVTYNPIDPISGTYTYLPYYENTDWSYTLQVIYKDGVGWVFRHLPFNHPLDPNDSVAIAANSNKIIANGPINITAMQSTLPEYDWTVNNDVSWNGTIDSSSINGQDRDIVTEVIKTQPGNTTIAPLNVTFNRIGSGGGYYDTQMLPLYLDEYAIDPVAYTGFRKRDTNNDNRLLFSSQFYESNYSVDMISGDSLYAVWLEQSDTFSNEESWDINTPFENFLQVPQPPSSTNYDLIRVENTDWEDIIGPEDPLKWQNLNSVPINDIPNVNEQDPTEVDPTIFTSGSDVICFNYVNQDIQVPYVSKAPDIDYGDGNFDYLSSVSIWLPEVNINIPQITSTPQIGMQFISFPDIAAGSGNQQE